MENVALPPFHQQHHHPFPGRARIRPVGKVRPAIQMLRESFLSSYDPNRENSIDEAMVKFKGRSTLKQLHAKEAHKTWVQSVGKGR